MRLFLGALILFNASSSVVIAGGDPVLSEVTFGSRKYCAYTIEGKESMETVTCSVPKDQVCSALIDCEKDQDVTLKVAKSEDPNDIKARKSDGSQCIIKSEVSSIHHVSGTFFCSTIARCGTKQDNFLTRVSCLGTPDPEKDGHALCPGLSVCLSPKKILPRPPVNQTVVASPVSVPSTVAGSKTSTSQKTSPRGVHK